MAYMMDEKLAKEHVASHLQNASLTPLNDIFDPNLTNSNFNGRWDFIFNEMYHENPVIELKEENSSLIEEYQGYFDNQQHMYQSTCMANNLGAEQDLVTSSSSYSSLELPGIAELLVLLRRKAKISA